ncbi:hypothetical protein ACIBU0_09685 [Streptomyces sp. NPDC049627]|uniref:hypothetical protein n=1 Tax=Streptomyces sp. NPDC049627 TaxID=3365595 RepID=UPI0037B3444F
MTAPRRGILAMAAALMVAGCSSSGSPDAAPTASSPAATSSTPRPRPTATATSAFCLDLETFQVGVVAFRSDVGAAIEGQPLDFEDLRARAALIARTGKEMQASAPRDIAGHFRAVLKAIDASASGLKQGAKVRDVVDPLYGKHILPAFDAVDSYDCGAVDG